MSTPRLAIVSSSAPEFDTESFDAWLCEEAEHEGDHGFYPLLGFIASTVAEDTNCMFALGFSATPKAGACGRVL